MNTLKKFVSAALIAGTAILTLSGCQSKVFNTGALAISSEEAAAVDSTNLLSETVSEDKRMTFNSTNDLLIALETGKISAAGMP